MSRREFTRAVKVAIRKRATRDGTRYCEKCGGKSLRGEVHHKAQDAMQVDKARPLTARDGEYLCQPCHGVETKRQAAELALVKAQEAYHAGVKKGGPKIGQPKKAEKKPMTKVTPGKTGIARRYGL